VPKIMDDTCSFKEEIDVSWKWLKVVLLENGWHMHFLERKLMLIEIGWNLYFWRMMTFASFREEIDAGWKWLKLVLLENGWLLHFLERKLMQVENGWNLYFWKTIWWSFVSSLTYYAYMIFASFG
jgi:hypothetical protein